MKHITFLSLLLFAIAFPYSSYACHYVSVKEYGAVGNGVVDDSKAIQQAFDDNKCVLFPEGEYLITRPITISSGHRIKGKSSVLRASCQDKAIIIDGEKISIEGFEIDGKGIAVHGIWVAYGKDISVKDCSFHRFYGTNTDQANAIYISSNSESIKIDHCKFNEIDAPQNGKIGDLYGSCQGILVMKVQNCVIKNCTFDNVKSVEDGDCIQVFGGRGKDNRWDNSTVRIEDCIFNNIWHRAIKLQGSSCSVKRCKVTADESRRPSAAIEVFGDNCSLRDVSIKLDYGIHALTISGDGFFMKNCSLTIDENNHHSEVLKNRHADVVYCIGKDCHFEKNSIIGSYIGFYSPNPQSGLRMKKNLFSSSTLRNIRIYNDGVDDILIEDNTFQGTRVPIEMGSGNKVRIITNKMLREQSAINIFGPSFSGVMRGNTNNGDKAVEINYLVIDK